MDCPHLNDCVKITRQDKQIEWNCSGNLLSKFVCRERYLNALHLIAGPTLHPQSCGLTAYMHGLTALLSCYAS